MKHEILILENFQGTGKTGKLFFTRYDNSNPALFFIADDDILTEFSIDLINFYCDYPFGEYRLIVLKSSKIAENLFEFGVVNSPVFNVEHEEGSFPVCELSDQVTDLLKEEGRFYV